MGAIRGSAFVGWTMGELGLVQEDTIEEIGASIRRMMSDGDVQSAASPTSKPTPIEMGESLGNVANSFKYEPESETAGELPNNVVELAIAQAMTTPMRAPGDRDQLFRLIATSRSD